MLEDRKQEVEGILRCEEGVQEPVCGGALVPGSSLSTKLTNLSRVTISPASNNQTQSEGLGHLVWDEGIERRSK